MDFDVPGGHHTTMERTAVSLYAKELVDMVWKLDKENVMPKVVVSSHLLVKIPVGKAGLRPSDVVPISSRMDSLEKVVEKLSLSLISFTDKMSSGHSQQNTGTATMQNGSSAGQQVFAGVVGDVPKPNAPTWAEVMGNQGGTIPG